MAAGCSTHLVQLLQKPQWTSVLLLKLRGASDTEINLALHLLDRKTTSATNDIVWRCKIAKSAGSFNINDGSNECDVKVVNKSDKPKDISRLCGFPPLCGAFKSLFWFYSLRLYCVFVFQPVSSSSDEAAVHDLLSSRQTQLQSSW